MLSASRTLCLLANYSPSSCQHCWAVEPQEEALMSCAEKRQAETIDAERAERSRLEEAAAKAEAAAEAELARRIASHQAAGPSW